jgi:DNA gyrase subunit B
MFRALPPKLIDCQFHPVGVSAELLIVEGDSASNAIGNVRDASFQAVMPMQGKPLNAWKASRDKVARNEFFDSLQNAIGAGWGDSFQLELARYERIVLVFDPDADGIHCGMLVLMYFYRWMRPLLNAGRIDMVHPPLFEITAPGMTELICAVSEEEAAVLLAKVQLEVNPNAVKKRFRGLASMSASVLKQTCVQVATRHSFRMRAKDAEAAIAVFCPKNGIM